MSLTLDRTVKLNRRLMSSFAQWRGQDARSRAHMHWLADDEQAALAQLERNLQLLGSAEEWFKKDHLLPHVPTLLLTGLELDESGIPDLLRACHIEDYEHEAALGTAPRPVRCGSPPTRHQRHRRLSSRARRP